MLERVNCCIAGCHNCSEGICVGKTYIFEEKLYVCKAYKRKHKEIDARECGQFRCNTPDIWNCCEYCRKGK